jgi:hypothetical protein
MPKIEYRPRKFQAAALLMIEQANAIFEEYAAQNITLSLRGLHYQFRDRHQVNDYSLLSRTMNRARWAGLVDWEALEDGSRRLHSITHWDGPADLMTAAARQFHTDLWAGQDERIEVWIEKDTQLGIIAGVCNELRVPYFSCHGDNSATAVWTAAQRFGDYMETGQAQEVVVLYLGDHDPKGVQMNVRLQRDLDDICEVDGYGGAVFVDRIALTMNQVRLHNLFPEVVQETKDTRAYVEEFGTEKWELDALNPTIITALIRAAVEPRIDQDAWTEAAEVEKVGLAGC